MFVKTQNDLWPFNPLSQPRYSRSFSQECVRVQDFWAGNGSFSDLSHFFRRAADVSLSNYAELTEISDLITV